MKGIRHGKDRRGPRGVPRCCMEELIWGEGREEGKREGCIFGVFNT